MSEGDVVDVATAIGELRGKIVHVTPCETDGVAQYAVRLLPGQFARGTLLCVRENDMTLAPMATQP